jgi:hypothetical protein
VDVLYTSYDLSVQRSEQAVLYKAKYYCTKSYKGKVESQFKAACGEPREVAASS